MLTRQLRRFSQQCATIAHRHLNTGPPPPSRVLKSRDLGILGVPLHYGQRKSGVDTGPEALRKGNLVDALRALNWNVSDFGDIDIPPLVNDDLYNHVKFPRTCGQVNRALWERGTAIAKAGGALLNLGGDHSMAVGTISTMLSSYENPGVIWVDAHADINTVDSSPSGSIHGMPIALTLKQGPKLPGFEWLDTVPALRPDQIVYVGLRDVDPGERTLIRELGIRAFSIHDVDRFGLGAVMQQALECLLGPNCDSPRPLLLSFDIDVVDPFYAPSTGTAVSGGLTYRESQFVCEAVALSGCMAAMDLVEVNPTLMHPTEADKTVTMARELVLSAFGEFPL